MIRRFSISILFILFTFILFVPISLAQGCINNPNNIFGIGLAQPHDEALVDAAKLVNSSGGEWGYVTIIIQENDRNQEKWQKIFDRLRELKLIPIIRLATQGEGVNWRRPKVEDAGQWANFLNSLNWVVEERYVVLFNEPNQAREWGGQVDPSDYAKVADAFARQLKAKNRDFFVMMAGLDNGAPQNLPNFASVLGFLAEVKSTIPNIFDNIDGWASHSYANPGFAGTHYGVGLKSVRAYHSELLFLQELGVNKDLPVFITEVGWPGDDVDGKYPSREKIAEIYKLYFENIKGDRRICAITPFILDYQEGLFAKFSWRRISKPLKTSDCLEEFYPQYCEVQKIAKIKGDPIQKNLVNVKADLASELTEDSVHNFKIILKNLGQAIWDAKDGYKVSSIDGEFGVFCSNFVDVRPGAEQTLECTINTPKGVGERRARLGLIKGERIIQEVYNWNFKTFPIPKLSFKIDLFPATEDDSDYEVQIFDENEKLVFNKKNVAVINGAGEIRGIKNISLGRKSRVVILKSGYLPRQQYVLFDKNEVAEAKFKTMLALDRDHDGQFTIRGDVLGISTR